MKKTSLNLKFNDRKMFSSSELTDLGLKAANDIFVVDERIFTAIIKYASFRHSYIRNFATSVCLSPFPFKSHNDPDLINLATIFLKNSIKFFKEILDLFNSYTKFYDFYDRLSPADKILFTKNVKVAAFYYSRSEYEYETIKFKNLLNMNVLTDEYLISFFDEIKIEWQNANLFYTETKK